MLKLWAVLTAIAPLEPIGEIKLSLQLVDFSHGYGEANCDEYLLTEDYISSASTQPKRGPRRTRRADRRWVVRNNGTVARRQGGHHRGTEAGDVFAHHHGYGYEAFDPHDNGVYRRQLVENGVINAAFDQLNDDSEIAFFWEDLSDSTTPITRDPYYQYDSAIDEASCFTRNFFQRRDEEYQFWLDHGYYYDKADYDDYDYGCFDDDGDDYATWGDEYAEYLLNEEYVPASTQPKRGSRRTRRADRRWVVRNNGTVARRQGGHHRGTEAGDVFAHHHGYGYEAFDPHDNGVYRRQLVENGVINAAFDQLNDDSEIAFFWE